MHESVGRDLGVLRQRFAGSDAAFEIAAPERAVDDLVPMPSQESDGYLGLPIDVSSGQPIVSGVVHVNNAPVVRITRDGIDRAREYPGMASQHRSGATFSQKYFTHSVGFSPQDVRIVVRTVCTAAREMVEATR